MFTGWMLRRIRKRIVATIRRRIRSIKGIKEVGKAPVKYISAIDLIMPIDGISTYHQVISITRMLDVILIRDGKEPYWEKRLSELVYGKQEEGKSTFGELVGMLDKWGWTLLNNPRQLVPVCFAKPAYSISESEERDGIRFFVNRGMTKNEVDTIISALTDLCSQYGIVLGVLLNVILIELEI